MSGHEVKLIDRPACGYFGKVPQTGDFIRNAALARDSGYTRDFFVNRLEEDFQSIRAFPPQLRWFVHDSGDEVFLRGEVEAVFGTPVASELHRAGFFERCIQRAERESSAGG